MRDLRRDSEVGQFDVSGFREQDVGAFDVAVDFALGVQIRESLKSLATNVSDLVLAKRASHVINVLETKLHDEVPR